MNKNNLGAGIAIMIGLIFLGLMLPAAVRQNRNADRTVSVKGLCEQEVAADKVIWPLQFRLGGNDLQVLLGDIQKKNSIIMDFLASGGIKGEEIAISTPNISDKFAQEYVDNNRVYRYLASCTVTVCTKNVDAVLKLMSNVSALCEKGVALNENKWDETTMAQFIFDGLNDIKPQMIQEATRNAREVAQRFAEDSGSSLGKIKTASQGVFSISDRDAFTPQIKTVRVVTNVVYYLNN